MKNSPKVNSKSTPSSNMEGFDLLDLLITIWNKRKFILRVMIFFSIAGLLIALLSTREYTASTTMVPQINSPTGKVGGLSSLASFAGFNISMSSGGNEISPVIYPQIVNSISFRLELMNSKFKFEELNQELNLYDYYTKHYKPGVLDVIKKYTIGLPGLLLKVSRGKDNYKENTIDPKTLVISKEQHEVLKIIGEKLDLNINDEDGYLVLSSKFHQPELSAQIAQKAQVLLQEYITSFKIEKAESQLSFIEQRYQEKKKEFEEAQTRLAQFRDANINIASAVAKTREEQLENEYRLAFEVYSELAKQLEQARIKVKEETPVFSIIDEVVVPVEKSKPKRAVILVIWLVFGVIAGMILVTGQIFLTPIKEELKNKESKTIAYNE